MKDGQTAPKMRLGADLSGDEMADWLGQPTLGAAVRARRRALHLTQQDLADLAGVGVRLVHELENDHQAVQLSKLTALLDALGLHLQLARGMQQ